MIGRGDFREIADSFGLAASIKPFGFVVLPLGAGAGAVAAWVGPRGWRGRPPPFGGAQPPPPRKEGG